MRFVSIGAVGIGLCLSAAAQQATQMQSVAKSWMDNTTIRGDLGYRFERIDEQGKDVQQRDRIRARVGAASRVTDAVKAEIELSTGGENPVSAYQSLGDASGRKEFRLNLAYIEWNPLNDAALSGGKMRNPFTDPGSLIWDADVTPEGIALRWSHDVGALRLQANAGYLWLQERGTTDDSRVYAGQVTAKYDFSKTASLTVGGSCYAFDGLDGLDVIDWRNQNNAYGNSTVNGTVNGSATNKAYATGFLVVDGFARLAFRAVVPVDVFGQYVVNTDADDNNEGYAAGVALGKAKAPHSVEIGYVYRRLEKDASVGFLTDSESWGGGTDGAGHKVYARYQVARNVQCGVNYFMTEKALSDDNKKHDYDKFQFDIGVKF